jgi:type I restriction enzyme S subunit
MRSSYKRLGDYIQEVNIRNRDLSNIPLLGVSIKKVLMPSIANIIGTDMSTYKLIKKNQFAYGPVTSRNGDKISIALLEKYDNAMVSQAYTVFEIIDESELLPEYLMMWFRRPEFDRYARFMSHGSAREIFSWTEMCETLLPIPSIEKQQEIVREYLTIQNRIALNNQLISNLEETAQAIYNKVVKENQCEEYLLKDLCSFQEGYVNPSQEYANYFDGDIKWLRANDVNGGFILNTTRTLTEEGFNSAGSSALLFKPQTIVITKSGTIGRLGILCDYMCGNRAVINIKPKEEYNLPLIFFFLKSKYNELVDMAVGSAQANLYVPILASMRINLPDKKDLTHFYLASNSILELLKLKTIENQKLAKLQDLLLAKMTRVESEKEIVL